MSKKGLIGAYCFNFEFLDRLWMSCNLSGNDEKMSGLKKTCSWVFLFQSVIANSELANVGFKDLYAF